MGWLLFDVVMTGSTPGDDPVKCEKTIDPYAHAGLTWWLESLYGSRNSAKDMRARIRQDPPKV